MNGKSETKAVINAVSVKLRMAVEFLPCNLFRVFIDYETTDLVARHLPIAQDKRDMPSDSVE